MQNNNPVDNASNKSIDANTLLEQEQSKHRELEEKRQELVQPSKNTKLPNLTFDESLLIDTNCGKYIREMNKRIIQRVNKLYAPEEAIKESMDPYFEFDDE